MPGLEDLYARNRAWAEGVEARDPDFFARLSAVQRPEYLWIGCADSRVPANEIVGLLPGELFVHRNVANLVVHTDLNCLSVIQYAVEALEVRHVLVVGHYGCGGVAAALEGRSLGLIDNWLRHVQDVIHENRDAIAAVPDAQRMDAICELNVMQQAVNVSRTTVVQGAWSRGQDVTVHACVYGLADGRLRDLGLSVTAGADLEGAHRAAVRRATLRTV